MHIEIVTQFKQKLPPIKVLNCPQNNQTMDWRITLYLTKPLAFSN